MKAGAVLLIIVGALALAWSVRVFAGGADGTDSGQLYIAVGVVFVVFGVTLLLIGLGMLKRSRRV